MVCGAKMLWGILTDITSMPGARARGSREMPTREDMSRGLHDPQTGWAWLSIWALRGLSESQGWQAGRS
jgi:hypothetical protein